MKKKVCLVSGKEICEGDRYFSFRAEGGGSKFYVLRDKITGKENFSYFHNLALKYPERGFDYEKLGKEMLEKILWKSALINIPQLARKKSACAM